MEQSIGNFPIHVEQDLQWGEMDAFDHINNTVYFVFFENARIKFMAETGLMTTMSNTGIGPILARTDANFKIPLTYPDVVRTYIRVKSIGNSSFTLELVVWSKNFDALACTGEAVIVMINYKTGEKVQISEDMRETLNRFTGV